MPKFYSPSQRGFYDTSYNPIIPKDAVSVTQEDYDALFAARADGKEIQPDANGNPQAVTPAPTPQAQAVAAIAAGINLASAGTPSLNSTYPIDAVAQSKISAVALYIVLNNAFPGGETTLKWIDATGQARVFNDVATFKGFASAVANFLAAVTLYADSNAEHGSIPSADISIV